MAMIYLYVACLIIGGILLGGSLLLGALHADADGDHDADHDGDHGGDHDAEQAHDGADAAGIWLPFFSMRFWVFSLTFFGLCGTLLTFLQIGPLATGAVALAVGVACGTGAAYVVHRLGKIEATGDVPTEAEFVGAVGEVLVGVAPGKRGKVRVEIRNHAIDLVAVTTGDETVAMGGQVLVVEYDNDVATVTRTPLATGGAEG
jgi:hypothetical protein